jgi:hypothetical protein
MVFGFAVFRLFLLVLVFVAWLTQRFLDRRKLAQCLLFLGRNECRSRSKSRHGGGREHQPRVLARPEAHIDGFPKPALDVRQRRADCFLGGGRLLLEIFGLAETGDRLIDGALRLGRLLPAG